MPWSGSPSGGTNGDEAALTDILAGHAADERLLAELYDLEHDQIVEDFAFYREWTRRQPGDVVDLGCGSGRLFGAFIEGGAQRIIGIDASAALLERAEKRIEDDPALRKAAAAGRIELILADLRTIAQADRFALAVMAGVLSHLAGAADAGRALTAAAALLAPHGQMIVDVLGPGGLPERDLPLSLDWNRTVNGRRVVRRSQLERRDGSDGLRVTYATITDLEEPDGTMARLSASFPLWYPSPSVLFTLAAEAGLEVEATFGSYDLDPLDEGSDRCIAVMRRATATPGRG